MLKTAIFSNSIEGLEGQFKGNALTEYAFLELLPHQQYDLSEFDVLIAPNGTDHVAMLSIKDQIQRFLDAGKTLCCFDGWFTKWIPGNRWVMDNSVKTIDIRYRVKTDWKRLSSAFNLEHLSFSHGISGWWACGYIEPAANATVFLEDNFGRPLVVIDESSTAGTLILTASGPLGDYSYATTDANTSNRAMTDLYHGILCRIQETGVKIQDF